MTIEARKFTFWKVILLAILCGGAYAAIVRYAFGLGAATHLSDSFPWGLWIGFDVLVGVGLAAGGFVIAATVHVFRIERYEAIARPTILTAFLGYLLVCVALLFDLGMPHRIWHPLIMWNPHSVMFEIGWCVMLYTTVLALEFSPLVFERFNLRRPLKLVRMLYIPLVIAGVLLSTLHQSSLGTLYVIAPGKLHGLWYSPLLPVFFFISAIAGGLAMTIFESFISRRAFGRELEGDLLRGLGRVIVVVLAVLAVWRLQDLALRGNFGLIFRLTPESVMFWGEFILGIAIPLALFALPRVRASESGLLLASMLTIMGFVVNRLNVAITGMISSSGVTYVPSWMEFAVTIAIVAAGFALFAAAVRYLAVFPEGPAAASATVDPLARLATIGRPVFGGTVLFTLWALLLAGGVAVAYSLDRGATPAGPRARPATSEPSRALPADASLPAPFTFPSSEESPGPVVFDHRSHVDPHEAACDTCHRSMFRINEAGVPLTGALDYERIHQGDLCASCHATDDDCGLCH
ncbi:MAG TPA: Ni/Fe-hydrogenase cytochrome b subunit [Candidatus Polarisedimenticolaceae bacterium]|nr:Ni/Fe-hydrogenase cytochrome b subunit [Candidatus Polarisedimenticolaceae bacterium]